MPLITNLIANVSDKHYIWQLICTHKIILFLNIHLLLNSTLKSYKKLIFFTPSIFSLTI